MRTVGVDIELVGDGLPVPAWTGSTARMWASTPAASTMRSRAGCKSQLATAASEYAREAIRRFAGRSDRDDVTITCRNTTEAINHLAYRLPLAPGDVVLTTVVEHHANLLP